MNTWLVDLGNSRWKLARVRDGELHDLLLGEYAHGLSTTAEAALSRDPVARVLVAGVVHDRLSDRFIDALQRVTGVQATRIENDHPLPNVRCGYRKPEQIGIDRLMAMVAARDVSRAPLCVIDAGTAVTLDFVARDGMHLGGFILPGVRLFRECLLANTAVPRDEDADLSDVLGRDTPSGIALGARYAVAGIVEMFLHGSRALFGDESADVVLGGGDAEAFVEWLPATCITLPHLVLRGLAVVAAQQEA